MTFTGRECGVRRANPALAVLNPLPAHLEKFARDQKFTSAEHEEFMQAVGKYCEFHGADAEDITIEPWGEIDGDQARFLVGLGKAEDVSYSANHKARFLGSNKRGTPFRHEIEAPDTMLATTPDGEMTVIINKPGAKKRVVVRNWMEG